MGAVLAVGASGGSADRCESMLSSKKQCAHDTRQIGDCRRGSG